MKIIDLPTWYRTRAYINQKKQGNPTNSGIDVDITREAGNFNWTVSIEGETFWENAFDADFLSKEECERKFPISFVEKEETLEDIMNEINNL
jgi:hypothetical protein